MNSINRYITLRALAAQIRMERQTHKGAFLLVEGRTDKLRFGKFVDDVECVIIDCKGKPNVIGDIEILYDSCFRGALGMVDADFDRLTSSPKEHEAIIVSEAHDFDIEMLLSSAFDRYLVEVGDAEKLRVFASTLQFRGALEKIQLAPRDERVGSRIYGGPVKGGDRAGTIYVLTHVDVFPQYEEDCLPLLKAMSIDTSKDDGNLGYEVLQQANHSNHFTVVEAWTTRTALDAHVIAAHTRAFRDRLSPMEGSPYDARFYEELD